MGKGAPPNLSARRWEDAWFPFDFSQLTLLFTENSLSKQNLYLEEHVTFFLNNKAQWT